jgi:tetratricopeptide (TPR) repeat protein
LSVDIREEPLDLLTYVWGPPDPNPPFEPKVNWPIYPYPLLDDIREEAGTVRYRALVVENEHLRVTVLPELGGHIHSAFDKASGEEVFYHNSVVKPGLLGLRGAWISGGIEWNFPCGHTVTTVSPVDARLISDDDGSATIWVGNVEQVSRMAWHVGIRLRPESSLIETEIRLTNRTALAHPYYFWANAAVPARDDLRLIYPGTRARSWMGHFDWPVHEGRDLARYTALDHSNDIFVLDSLEDFFGVYYDDGDRGLVHVADVHQAFGKKYFTWGTAEHGRFWSAALSDGDGPYCEIQSGRFVDQSTWQLMPPHHTESWTEWWYPLRGMGGFSWANRDAAVRLERRGGSLECGVTVTSPRPEAIIQLAAGDRVVEERRADLSPGRPMRFEAGALTGDGAITLILLDRDRRELIRYTEAQRPRTITLRETARPEESRPGELLTKALRTEERANPSAAWELYEKVLMIDPSCEEAALALGRLAIERKPGQAIPRLQTVAAALPESGSAAYHLGVALARAGRDSEAEVELFRAAHWPEFAHAARVELGLIAMRRGEWAQAVALLRDALHLDPRDVKAWALLMAALRKAGLPEQVLALADAAPQMPYDRLMLAEMHFALAALGRTRLQAKARRELASMAPAEPDVWIELALDYLGAGLAGEAVELVSWAEAHVKGVDRSPLLHYLLSDALTRLGRSDEAATVRERAAAWLGPTDRHPGCPTGDGQTQGLPPDLAFAHHWEFESVLRAAAAQDPGDTRAHYHLGNLLYAQGRREEALAEWEAAAESQWDYSVLRRNLALACQQVRGDLERAEAELRRAVELRPADVRLYLELNDVLLKRGATPDVRLAMLDSAPESVQRRGVIAAQQVVGCIELEQWDRALDILATHTFHRWEMEFRMRGIYLDACLGRGIARFDAGDLRGAREDFARALEYPLNLRIGRPAKPSDARGHWCAGVVDDLLGDMAGAVAHWKAAASEDYHQPGAELAAYRALALQKLDCVDEARALLSESLRLLRERAGEAPEDAGAQLLLGLALKASGDEREARAALERALTLDPRLKRAARLLTASVML